MIYCSSVRLSVLSHGGRSGKERTSLWYLMFTFTLLDFAWLHGPSSSFPVVTHEEAENSLIDDLLASLGHLGRSIINLSLLDIIYCVDTINESDPYPGEDSDWIWCRVLWCDVVDNALILTRPIGYEEWAGRDFSTIRSISSSLRLASLNGNPPSHHPLQTSFVVAGLGFWSCRRQRDPWAVSTSSLNKICYGQYNKISDKMTMFHY